MPTVLITTANGKPLIYWKRHPYMPSKAHVAQILLPFRYQGKEMLVLEFQDAPHYVRRHGWGPIALWTIQPCETQLCNYYFHHVLQHYPWPACLTLSQGEIVYANQAFGNSLGLDSETLVGKTFLTLLEQDSQEEGQEEKSDEKPSEKHWSDTIYRFKISHNTTASMIISHTLYQGEYVGILMLPADLVGAHLGDPGWLGQIPLPAALLDDNGGIYMMNRLLKERFNFSHKANLAQWIAEKDRYSFSQTLRRLRRDSEIHTKTTIHFRRQEQDALSVFLRYVTHSGAGDSAGDGKFLGVFHMADDTPCREAEPHKMQLLGELTSGIIHDFNNLLTGIFGFCDLLLQKHSPEDSSTKDIQQIKQSAMRAAALIQKLLAFSKSTPSFQSILSVKQCLTDLLPLIRHMVGPKILLSVEEDLGEKRGRKQGDKEGDASENQSPQPPEDSKEFEKKWLIFGDAGQLEQILLNLSINARDAMTPRDKQEDKQGGKLIFAMAIQRIKKPYPVIKNVLKAGTYVVMTIQDTGTGIDADTVERIFDPFFSTKDPGQGTGLGLANVLQIMEQFGGGIRMETQLGKGTAFYLYFPQHVERAGPSISLPPAPSFLTSALSATPSPSDKTVLCPDTHSTTAVSILLVEDEDPVRLFAARALREKGYIVLEARDGAQAMELATGELAKNHSSIHVLVTDVMMPGMDGPTLALMLKKDLPHLKILFVSGYPEEEVRRHIPPRMSDVYFLSKPFSLVDLVTKIQTILLL